MWFWEQIQYSFRVLIDRISPNVRSEVSSWKKLYLLMQYNGTQNCFFFQVYCIPCPSVAYGAAYALQIVPPLLQHQFTQTSQWIYFIFQKNSTAAVRYLWSLVFVRLLSTIRFYELFIFLYVGNVWLGNASAYLFYFIFFMLFSA